MKIALRKCHTNKIGGASKKLVETKECWELVDKLKPILEKYGHEVLIIEGKNNLSDHEQTKEGCQRANDFKADIYISFHMNDFHESSARGCEYIIYNNSSNKVCNMCKNIMVYMNSLGIPFRREIINPNFWELKYTNMEACIIELLFVGNEKDVSIWNNTSWNKIVYGIANGIDSKIPNTPPSEDCFYRVITGSFKSKANAEKRVHELEKKGFTSFIEIK